MATNWRNWPQSGTFEVTEDVEGRVLSDDPGDPLGDVRYLLPGTYNVTQEWQATRVAHDPEPGGVASFGGRYYTVDAGEPVIVPSHFGSFAPEP